MVEACARDGRQCLPWHHINQGDRQWRGLIKEKGKAFKDDSEKESLKKRENIPHVCKQCRPEHQDIT